MVLIRNGLSWSTITWRKRKHKVKINTTNSSGTELYSAVPQESVLEPLILKFI